MSDASEIQAIYDKWDREVRQRSREEALRAALLALYASRFGDAPEAVRAALEAIENEHTLLGLVPRFGTEAADEIAAMLGAET